MIEDETATGEGMPEPAKAAPAEPATAEPASAKAATAAPTSTGTVTLVVSGPSWCTGMRLPLNDGSTLSVDRRGVAVPADQAQTLIQTAAKHGVTITEVSEQ